MFYQPASEDIIIKMQREIATLKEQINRLNSFEYYSGVVEDDLRVAVSSTKLGGSKDPDFVLFRNNGAGSQGVFTYLFDASLEEELYFAAQFSHKRKDSTDITPHVHWTPTNTNTGTVRWGLEYVWVDIGSTFGNTTIIYAEQAGSGVAYQHQLADFADIDGSGISAASSMIVGRIFRDAGNGGDTYNADAALLEVDFHYTIDKIGEIV